MKLFLLIYLMFVKLEVIFSCIQSENIECFCTADVINCLGSIEDSVQIQQLFTNISMIHSSPFLESLVLNITNQLSLDDIFFTGFNIKNLTLINSFQNLSNNFLSSSFSDLHTLKIVDSSVHYIANEPFHSLYNLIELHLESNEIYGIKPEAFLNLSSLELLNLSKNKLSKIEENFLTYLPLIQTLLLNENNISSVSDIQVRSLSLTKLSAQNCNMAGVLEKNSLSGLSNLNYLDFSKNLIEGINSSALSSLMNIKELNLSKNSILYLEDNAFSELVTLEVLDLSSNKISLIKTTAFNKLSNLLHLDLKGNLLRAMLCDYTYDLHSLKKVDLRENRIKTINAGTFSYSHNIQELFLEGNALEEADAIICSPLPNITILFIDMDFESKNCEMPDPCGTLLPNNEDDYEEDFDDNSNVTTDYLGFSTEESESFSSSINPLNDSIMETTKQSFDTTESVSTFLSTMPGEFNKKTDSSLSSNNSTPATTNIDSFLVSSTYSGDIIATETDSTSTKIDINATSSEKIDFTYIETSFESTLELTTLLTELMTEQTESSSSSSTEKGLTNTKIQLNTESAITTQNVSTLFSEDAITEDNNHFNNTKLTYTTVETSSVSHKTGIIVSNYSFADKLCFQWKLVNLPPEKYVCIEKYDFCAGRRSRYLTCPKIGVLSEDCIERSDIIKFCLRLLLEGVEIDKTCIQPKPYKTCQNKSNRKMSSSTIPAFTTLMTKDVPLEITSFDVIYNTSYSGRAVWLVNTNKSSETCNLILTLTFFDSGKQEITFLCSNNSYVVNNLNDLEEICLQTKDDASGIEAKCRHNFAVVNEANAYKTKDHGYKNSSLLALSILLLVVLTLIILLVVRNLLKKRLDRDRYNVYIEEQNVQKRSSTLYQEPSVRYSYTPKE